MSWVNRYISTDEESIIFVITLISFHLLRVILQLSAFVRSVKLLLKLKITSVYSIYNFSV